MVSVLLVIDVARFHEKSALLESPEIYQDLMKVSSSKISGLAISANIDSLVVGRTQLATA